MKLHPVAQLILFAVALRLAADAILFARVVQFVTDPDNSMVTLASKVRLAGRRYEEFAQTLAYVGTAAWVEVLSRWWRRLVAQRVLRASTPSGAIP
jgi:hypothetical protein